MKPLLITILSLCICGSLFSQSSELTIQVKKESIGTSFRQDDERLKPKELLEIMANNPEASAIMKKAKSNYDASSVLGIIGGVLIGWPIGAAIAGGDANWTLAGVGAGFVVISLPFTAMYTKHAKNAVNMHNENLRRTGAIPNRLELGLSGNGICVKMKL